MANHYRAFDWLIPDDIQFSQHHNVCQPKSMFGAKGLMELSRSSSARYCFTCHKIAHTYTNRSATAGKVFKKILKHIAWSFFVC
jgi:hypothetical protein